MKWSLFLLLLIAVLVPVSVFAEAQTCIQGHSAGTYDCKKVTLQSLVPLTRFPGNPASASALWGYSDPDDHREYAIIGLRNGTAVVEVTNSIKPRIVGHIRGVTSIWREIKVFSFRNVQKKRWDAYAYVTTEGFNGGLQIIDLSGLPDRVSLASVNRDISTSHTIFISNLDYSTGQKLPGKKPRLYVNGSNRAGLVVYSLKNPGAPRLIGEYNQTYVHDCYAETFADSRAEQCAPGKTSCDLLFAWTGGDFRILDVSDPKNIRVLSTLQYPNLGYAHSGWITKDKKYLFNFDELDELDGDDKTRILTINISNLFNPRITGEYQGKFKSIEHNGIVIGNRLYLAHYTRGLVVMDVSKPREIKEVAFFDTYPEDDKHDEMPMHPGDGQNEFAGAWAVFPFLPSGNILISDINRGLFVLKVE